MEINPYQFLNPYDISFLFICLISIFFGIKNGILKSLLNLAKWISIYFIIKNCFGVLRPIVDPYVTNQSVSDIIIFIVTIITAYLLFSLVNRMLVGIIQPKTSLMMDLGFGSILGALRGYIIFVLIIFFIENNFSKTIVSEFIYSGSFQSIVQYGVNFLDHIPRNIEKINEINI